VENREKGTTADNGVRTGMAGAFVKRIVMGSVGVAVGIGIFYMLKKVVTGEVEAAVSGGALLVLMVMLFGMGCVLVVVGLRFILQALGSFTFSPGKTPESSASGFMKNMLGGVFLPGNIAKAFLYFTPSCRASYGTWKDLKSAMRGFKERLKKRHNSGSFYFEIKKLMTTPSLEETNKKIVVTFDSVFPGGPNEKARHYEQQVTLTTTHRENGWWIDKVSGSFGPGENQS